MGQYSTNLTDKQWQITEKILEPKHRKRKFSIRSIFDAVMYLVKTGCQWRMLPKDFPPYNTVYYYFNKWKCEGVFEKLTNILHVVARVLAGKKASPSLGIIDSRSIKSSHHVDGDKGIDGNKKIKGRKQHIMVDTLGLPMTVVVHRANIYDGKGALDVIEASRKRFPLLKKILADGGYKGKELVDAAREKLGCEFTVVTRQDESPKKFNVIPKRWIVERSFSWLENFRRIAMDYEFYADTGVAMVELAFCRIMLCRIRD